MVFGTAGLFGMDRVFGDGWALWGWLGFLGWIAIGPAAHLHEREVPDSPQLWCQRGARGAAPAPPVPPGRVAVRAGGHSCGCIPECPFVRGCCAGGLCSCRGGLEGGSWGPWRWRGMLGGPTLIELIGAAARAEERGTAAILTARGGSRPAKSLASIKYRMCALLTCYC